MNKGFEGLKTCEDQLSTHAYNIMFSANNSNNMHLNIQ